MRVRYFTDADRFWSRVQRAEPEQCWLWLGGKKAAGYGNMAIRRPDGSWTQTPAHRWSYAQMVGPIPAGWEVDHVCRVRACVNPAHLEAVPVVENRRRRDLGHPFALTRDAAPMPEVGRPKEAKRSKADPRTHCLKGHEYAVTGWAKNGGRRTCAACRAEAAARRRTGGQHGTETHCPQGHPYDEANTYHRRRPDGSVKGRECRTCVLKRNRSRRQARVIKNDANSLSVTFNDPPAV